MPVEAGHAHMHTGCDKNESRRQINLSTASPAPAARPAEAWDPVFE